VTQSEGTIIATIDAFAIATHRKAHAQGVVTHQWVPLLGAKAHSEQVTRSLGEVVVLHTSDQVQGDVLLFFHDGHFEAPHNLNVPLTQSGRLLCL